MIAPGLDPPPEALRVRWAEQRRLRIDGWLHAGLAEALLEHTRSLPHHLVQPGPTRLRYQLALAETRPDPTGGPLARFAAWWFGPGRAWVEALVGEPLLPPPEGTLVSTLYTRGCYLDPHNDQAPGRAVAFVVGLSPTPWPVEDGGWLEFMDFGAEGVELTEQRPPGFNTLDLFDVRAPGQIHRIPMLRVDHERRVLSGWFHAAG